MLCVNIGYCAFNLRVCFLRYCCHLGISVESNKRYVCASVYVCINSLFTDGYPVPFTDSTPNNLYKSDLWSIFNRFEATNRPKTNRKMLYIKNSMLCTFIFRLGTLKYNINYIVFFCVPFSSFCPFACCSCCLFAHFVFVCFSIQIENICDIYSSCDASSR